MVHVTEAAQVSTKVSASLARPYPSALSSCGKPSTSPGKAGTRPQESPALPPMPRSSPKRPSSVEVVAGRVGPADPSAAHITTVQLTRTTGGRVICAHLLLSKNNTV